MRVVGGTQKKGIARNLFGDSLATPHKYRKNYICF
nr:MAG TPA: hypothetical protein [Caudoviricetes sp.]